MQRVEQGAGFGFNQPPPSWRHPASLQGRHVHVVGSSVLHVAIVVLDPESELDHPVDALGVDLGILEAEPRGEEAGLKQEHHQVFTDLSFLSASARWRKFSMMPWSGLISMCFLAAM